MGLPVDLIPAAPAAFASGSQTALGHQIGQFPPGRRATDTGFLVALFDRKDHWHDSAKRLLATRLRAERAALLSVWPTVVETCFFLNACGKLALLEWIRRGALRLRPIEPDDIDGIRRIIERYADQQIDLADATLVWLAEVEGTRRILTTDRRDFAYLRTQDNQPVASQHCRPVSSLSPVGYSRSPSRMSATVGPRRRWAGLDPSSQLRPIRVFGG